MKKIIFGLSALLVLMFSGCGGGSGGSSSSSSSPASTASDAANAPQNVAVNGLPPVPQIPADN